MSGCNYLRPIPQETLITLDLVTAMKVESVTSSDDPAFKERGGLAFGAAGPPIQELPPRKKYNECTNQSVIQGLGCTGIAICNALTNCVFANAKK